MKRIYAMELESLIVKIGISQDVANRMKQVAYARKERVINVHFTEFAPDAVARQIEQTCHEAFADRRLFGEYFDVPFAEACAMLDSYEDEIELAAIDAAAAEVERLDDVEEEHSGRMTINEALQRFRQEQHLTRKAIADALGVKPQSYIYEKKDVTPSAQVIADLAKAFNVSADYLLGLSDQPKPAAELLTVQKEATHVEENERLKIAILVNNAVADALQKFLAGKGEAEQIVKEQGSLE